MKFRKHSSGKVVLELIKDQAKYLVEAAQLLDEVAHAEESERVEINKRLHDVENQADMACHKVQKFIFKSFVLPYDRSDLFDLTNCIDDCIDCIDEAGDNMVLYRVGRLGEEAYKMIDIINECATMTNKEMGYLHKLNEKTRTYIVGINHLENHGDTIYRGIISELFRSEETAIDLMRMKGVIDSLEATIDEFETLAGLVEDILMKES